MQRSVCLNEAQLGSLIVTLMMMMFMARYTQKRLHTRTQRCCQELPVTLIRRSRAGAACPWGPVLPIVPVGVRQSQVMLEFVRASSTGLEHVLEHGTSHRGHGGLSLPLYILLYENCPHTQ